MDFYLSALHVKVYGLMTLKYSHEISAKLAQLLDTIYNANGNHDVARKYDGIEDRILLNYIEKRGGESQAVQIGNFLKSSELSKQFIQLKDHSFNTVSETLAFLMGIGLCINGAVVMFKLNVLGLPICAFYLYIQILLLYHIECHKMPNSVRDLHRALTSEPCKSVQEEYLAAHLDYVEQVNKLSDNITEQNITDLIKKIEQRSKVQARRNAAFKAADNQVDKILSYNTIWTLIPMVGITLIYTLSCVLMLRKSCE